MTCSEAIAKISLKHASHKVDIAGFLICLLAESNLTNVSHVLQSKLDQGRKEAIRY